MTAREQILACAPYAGYLMRTEALDESVILAAFADVAARGIEDVDDARIVAYARYAGADEDAAADLYRRAGLETILRRELGRHGARTYVDPERVADQLEHTSDMQVVGWLA
ncbi:MAG: hypothetical protein JWP44_4480, partial [Mucilaginibacter sp.]|nr:hypothetical protein [Mucilaginibacter sp.]